MGLSQLAPLRGGHGVASALALGLLGLERRLGRADALQARLASGELLGQLIAAALGPVALILGLVCGLGFAEHGLRLGADRGDLSLEGGLGLDHALVGHRLVRRGRGPELGAVEGERAELDQAGLLTEPQSLHEQLGQRLEVAAAKAGDRAVVGVLVGAQHAHGDIAVGGLLELARGGRGGGVAVDQELQHQARVVGRVPPLSLVRGIDRGEIERGLDQVADEMGEIALGHPLREHRRHQEHLVGVIVPKRLVLAGGRRRRRSLGLGRLDLDQPLLGPRHRLRHARPPRDSSLAGRFSRLGRTGQGLLTQAPRSARWFCER